MRKKKPVPGSDLTPQRKLFCDLYVSEEFFGNGTQAYIKAYNVDLSKKGAYRSARADASKLLTKSNVCAYINHLLDAAGLNDIFVDKQLLFLVNQHAELSAKLGAIREYNALRGRITQKVDHSGKVDTGRTIIQILPPGSGDQDNADG